LLNIFVISTNGLTTYMDNEECTTWTPRWSCTFE